MKKKVDNKEQASVSKVYVVNSPLTHAAHVAHGSINYSNESKGMSSGGFQAALRRASRKVSEPVLRRNET